MDRLRCPGCLSTIERDGDASAVECPCCHRIVLDVATKDSERRRKARRRALIMRRHEAMMAMEEAAGDGVDLVLDTDDE